MIACILLGFFVLVQNPKGGGLSGSFGGFGNQVMGVRQTTDVLEKGTWILAGAIALLCLTSTMFIGRGTDSSNGKSVIEGQAGGSLPSGNTAPLQQQVPAGNDTSK